MSVVSPRPLIPFIGRHGMLTNENFALIQALVDSLNGLKDDNDFLYTIILGIRITVGTGSPENVVTGSRPDIFLRTDGAAGSTVYAKSSGTETSTGWAAL